MQRTFVTVTAHGGCVEPGGMDLEDRCSTHPCPRCGAPARHWSCERIEGGSINTYAGMRCGACGHREGDDPDSPP